MEETKVQLECVCASEHHSEHLCYIISQGLHLTDEDVYVALTEEPRFRCDHCGRTARNGANLCVPEVL